MCVMHTDFSTLCGLDSLCMLHTQTLCVLNIDAKSEDCRQVVHVSQIQTLVFCMVNSSGVCVCVSHTDTLLSVPNIDITAQAWLPEIDVGEALGVLKIACFFSFSQLQKPHQHALKALNGSRGCLKQICGISKGSPRRLW